MLPASNEIRPGRRKAARFAWVLSTVLVIAAFGGGWAAALNLQSPEQRAAAAHPPPPQPVTAVVEQDALTQTLSATATVTRANRRQVLLPAAQSTSAVTKQPLSVGSTVANGSSMLEVNGRPVFAFPGTFPFYRDLTLGDSGPDVSQLQSGLQAAGHPLTVDGNFGPATDRALRTHYANAGYKPKQSSTAIPMTKEPATGTSEPAPTEAIPTPVILIPLTELVVVAELPAFVVAIPALGTLLGETSSATLEDGDVVAIATVTSAVASNVRLGMPVDLTGPNNEQIPVAVASVGMPPPPSADGIPTDDVTIVLASTADPLPDTWLNAEVLAVITVQVAAEESILVPTIAVVTGAGGRSHVLKQQDDGVFISVPVIETAVLGGRSAITPKDTSALVAGDLVRVG